MKVIPILFASIALLETTFGGGSQQMFFGIQLDPGTRGELFNSRTLDFSDIDGASADGVGLELDFDFEVDEQLRFSDTGSDGFDVVLELVYSAPSGPVVDIPDCSVRMIPAFEAFTVPAGSSTTVDGTTVTYTAHFEDQEGVFFNSLRYNVIDPSIGGATITDATLSFVASGPGGSFEVTSPQAPAAVLVDSFTGVTSGKFPVEDDNLFNPNGATERPFDPSVAYQRDTSIFLRSGTSVIVNADTSGSGSMDFVVAEESTATFFLSYSLGRHDITQGGTNDQLVIDVTGISSLEVRLNDMSDSAVTTVPVINNQVVIPLELASFDGPPSSFDFTRVSGLRIETPAAVGAGTYTVEQVAFTTSTGPQVLSIKPDSTGPVPSGVGMNYTVLFSEPVTGFNNIFDLDTNTTNITSAPAPLSLQTSDNTTYTFTLRPSIIDGVTSGTMVTAIAPAGGIIDGDSNPLVAPNPFAELVTISASAYQLWAIDQLLTPGLNFGYSQDPDSDNRINGAEFVRNTSALSSDDPQREFFHLTEVEGVQYGTLTVASPTGRDYAEIEDGWLQSDFSGGDSGFVVDVADNIRATDDLSFDRFTSPAIILDPGITELPGLPALDEGWSWYHFRFEDSTGALGKGFMRTDIEDLD